MADVLRVRISFPALEWAYVEALAPPGSKAISTWALVHRLGDRWHRVRFRRPVCSNEKIPSAARRQLFSCRH
jgi:hypothetical protein